MTFCLRCGGTLVERELAGHLRQACPACGWVAYPQPKLGAAVLVERDGLLLVQRGPGTAFAGDWCLPSGYCEADESPPVTAARETAEETGLAVRVSSLFNAFPFDDDPRGNGVLLVYWATPTGGSLRVDGQEAVDVGFFPADALPAPLSGGGHDRAVAAWRAHQGRPRWEPGMPMRFCPHCTAPLTEREAFGRVRPVCPACGFVHLQDPKLGVAVVVERDGAVLLVRRAVEPALGLWGLPAGFVEFDEDPKAAAVRECREETGLAVELGPLLAVHHYEADFRGPGVVILYTGRVAGGRLIPADDVSEARFFRPHELPPDEAIAFASNREALALWRRGDGATG
jgi:ADP-ribose pyrophosphatase YjhB (NUDIX family)